MTVLSIWIDLDGTNATLLLDDGTTQRATLTDEELDQAMHLFAEARS